MGGGRGGDGGRGYRLILLWKMRVLSQALFVHIVVMRVNIVSLKKLNFVFTLQHTIFTVKRNNKNP